MSILTIILSLIILAVYIFLLIAKQINKSNWAENTVVNHGVYIILIVLSFIYGIRELMKQH